MTEDSRIKLIALFLVSRQIGIPVPTDLQVALVNAGVITEHLDQAALMYDHVEFIRGCLVTPNEDLEQMDLPEDVRENIYRIKDLLSPLTEAAIEEEIEYGQDTEH